MILLTLTSLLRPLVHDDFVSGQPPCGVFALIHVPRAVNLDGLTGTMFTGPHSFLTEARQPRLVLITPMAVVSLAIRLPFDAALKISFCPSPTTSGLLYSVSNVATRVYGIVEDVSRTRNTHHNWDLCAEFVFLNL
ncbi:hypothetical protein RSAG8_04285, partial [Rhizoctonia solani AG-8 WAC10335]